MLHVIAGYAGGVITALACIVYAVAIVRGKVQSNKVTWFVWSFVTALMFLSYWQTNGFVSSVWVPLASFGGTALVFILMATFVKKGEWTWVEKVCLGGVAATFIVWAVSGSPVTALTATMLIDAVGAIPLVVMVYKDPKADYAPAWYIGALSNMVNLAAIEHWDYANAAYPLYMVVLTVTISVLLGFPRFLRKGRVRSRVV